MGLERSKGELGSGWMGRQQRLVGEWGGLPDIKEWLALQHPE